MRQAKARLIEPRGTIQVVIVFCDCWDSASFQEEHREELWRDDGNGVRFLFVLVGVPDNIFVSVPVGSVLRRDTNVTDPPERASRRSLS